jgi:hypothetical protein
VARERYGGASTISKPSPERAATGDDRRQRGAGPHDTGHRGDEAEDAEEENGDRVVVVSHTLCKPSRTRFGDIQPDDLSSRYGPRDSVRGHRRTPSVELPHHG